MQNAGLAGLGLNWRYLAFDVHPDDLRAAIAGAKAMGFIGLNLTVPHKILALDMIEEIEPSARVWGAVNTIRVEGRNGNEWKPLNELLAVPTEVRAHGFNTDADAITRDIEEDLGVKVRGAAVLLLGAGGAGRTAALKLASEGVSELFLVNRTQSKAEGLLAEIRKNWPGVRVTLGYPKRRVELVLNTTSLGLSPEDALPWNEAEFSLQSAASAYDMIYRPAETTFLARAKAAGCKTSNGLGMLLYQGAAALELWTGRKAPVAEMRLALERHIYG